MQAHIEKTLADAKFRFLFFCGITAIVNIAMFCFLVTLGIDYKAANIIAIIFVKITAYFALKLFVFKSRSKSFREFLGEFFKFICSLLFLC